MAERIYELLILKATKEIVDIRPEGFQWKKGERDESVFQIVKTNISEKVEGELKRNIFEYAWQDEQIVHRRSGVILTEELIAEPNEFDVSSEAVDAAIIKRIGKEVSADMYGEVILDLLPGEKKDEIISRFSDKGLRSDPSDRQREVFVQAMHEIHSLMREKLWPLAMKTGDKKLIWATRYRGLPEFVCAVEELDAKKKTKVLQNTDEADRVWVEFLVGSQEEEGERK